MNPLCMTSLSLLLLHLSIKHLWRSPSRSFSKQARPDRSEGVTPSSLIIRFGGDLYN